MENRLARKTLRHDGVYPAAHLGCVGHAGTDFQRQLENVFSLRADAYPVHDAQRPGKKLDITLPNTLEIIILLFIYAAEIMGEIGAYYVTFPYWDTVLHTLNGFLCAAIGFSLLDILNRHSEARFTCRRCIWPSCVLLLDDRRVIWEFFECTMDQLFFLDMQKTPSSTRLAPSCWTPRAAIRPLC